MNYTEILNQLMPALISIAVTVVTAIAAWLGTKAKELLDTKEKKNIVESTVKYVEQIGKELGSEEKLALAKKAALEWLKQKGLTVSEIELNILIQAAVNDFFAHYESFTNTVPVIVEGTPIVEVEK